MANGMAGLFIGTTGLKTAQTALNTTAHNLSNINTSGYTRQQVTFSDTQYVRVNTSDKVSSPDYGLGVAVSEVRRIRDQFIDQAYRNENSRLGFYESQYKAIEEIEDQFGEMQGVTYESYLINLYNSVNELAKNPTSTVARSSLIQNATAFIEKSENVYKGLKDYQTTLNTQVKNMVDSINKLGDKIYTLNKKISKIESTGIEDANDLRDERDAAIDELSKYIDITYYENDSKEVIISAEGIPFVTMGELAKMDTRVVEGTNLVIPTWPGYERDVYDLSTEASNVDETDKGELKGLLIARGNMVVDYTVVPEAPSSSDYDMSTADGRAAYQEAYNKYSKAQEYYNTYIEPSAILSAMAGFDKLVNGIVEKINNILCPEKSEVRNNPYMAPDGTEIQADIYTYNSVSQQVLFDRYGREVTGTDNGDGTYSFSSGEKLYMSFGGAEVPVDSYTYSMLDMDKTGYGMDDNKTVGTELFSRKGTDRYIKTTDDSGKTIYIRNNLNETDYESLYKLGNLQINPEAAQNVGKIPLSTVQGKEDFDRAKELVDAWDEKFASLNPDTYAKSDFMTFYNNFIGEYATLGKALGNYVSNQTTMVDGYDNQRLQSEGVSSDEELEKMIKYQQAYNAASRYVNVVNQMLEHLVTSLGNA
ncbi:MAG: flagellar hook-associated protein FlgK [Lachnospira sp.]|nr:flagellar hook-associated protein FlgK [Lachnospira sp.]